MVSVEVLTRIPFFRGLPVSALRELAEHATERHLNQNEFIVRQHDEANAVFFLMRGSVQFLLRFEGIDDLFVGTSRERGELIGWSVFRIPYRYTSSVRCETACDVVRVPRAAFMAIVDKDHRFGYVLLTRVAAVLADRLEQTRDLLTGARDSDPDVQVGGRRR